MDMDLRLGPMDMDLRLGPMDNGHGPYDIIASYQVFKGKAIEWY
jgi:hypothetical protein